MKETFVVCPTCGAVSVVGGPCEYCGTQLVANEDSVTYEERIIPKRTISPMAYAQKVSVFKNVGEYICNCAVVSMGGLKGLINLNGDFIFPLEYGVIKIYPFFIVYFQKDDDRFLFDLLHWRRLNYNPIVSKTSNVPVMVQREFFFEDGNEDEYSYQFLAVKEYDDQRHERISFSVYDKDDREVIHGSDCYSTVKGGIILSNRQEYFDIQNQKVFLCPSLLTKNAHTHFCDKNGKLAIHCSSARGSETIGLDIKGKSVEGIQREIDTVIGIMRRSCNSSGGGGCGCYVATAVYGSYDCPEVWTLRRYRDNTLNKTWYGRAFVKCYYAISPTLVRWFGQSSWFRRMWKAPLDRIVMNLQTKGVQDTPYDDLY